MIVAIVVYLYATVYYATIIPTAQLQVLQKQYHIFILRTLPQVRNSELKI